MKLSAALLNLQTPVLVLKERQFLHNLQRMATHCQNRGLALRPHAKTHKCGRVAARQVRQGAVGICCATLSEAELLADFVNSILITSPIVSNSQFERARQLQSRIKELICVVDSKSVAKRMAATFDATRPLKVLLDLDPGMHRTGIPISDEALRLANTLHQSPSLDFCGIQCYAGNLQHVNSIEDRRKRVVEIWQRVAEFKDKMESLQIPCGVVSGGGTGTHDLDWQSGVLNELQAGSYPFMDLEYMAIEWDGDGLPFEPSLHVLTTIVSANTPGLATVDAGLKAFSTESVVPTIATDLGSTASYVFRGDEHGALVFEDAEFKADVGTPVLMSVPHCDPTINLHNEFLIVDDDWEVIDTWHIDARSGARAGVV